jgi:hypothetical protein
MNTTTYIILAILAIHATNPGLMDWIADQFIDAGLDCQKGPIQINQPILDWLVATLQLMV